MAAAIIGGLTAKGIQKQQLCVSEPWDVNREKMDALGVHTTTSNIEAAQDSDVLVLAMKPQMAKDVCQELGAAWAQLSVLPVVVSIAAGVTLASLVEWFKLPNGRIPHVMRVMPNNPALLGEGASGVYAGTEVTVEERELVTALLSSFSKATEWVDKEELLDVVTGLSGIYKHQVISNDCFLTSSLGLRTRLLFRHG
jgi:pyrroline-5-carboxylate reductase